MFKSRDRLLRLLVVVVAIEMLIAIVLRGPSVVRVAQGRAHPMDYLPSPACCGCRCYSG